MPDVFEDVLNDRMTLEQQANADDGGGGQTGGFAAVRSLRVYVEHLTSAEQLEPYLRRGYTDVMRVSAIDTITRTDGENSLGTLITKAGEDQFRLLWHGNRTLSPIGVVRPGKRAYGGGPDIVFIDCVETAKPTGFMDA
jgi:hypothetical protein